MCRELKASFVLTNVSVCDITIRGILSNKGVLDGKVARRKPLLFKKNIASYLQFVKDHVDKPEDNWKNVLWTDEIKIDFFLA